MLAGITVASGCIILEHQHLRPPSPPAEKILDLSMCSIVEFHFRCTPVCIIYNLLFWDIWWLDNLSFSDLGERPPMTTAQHNKVSIKGENSFIPSYPQTHCNWIICTLRLKRHLNMQVMPLVSAAAATRWKGKEARSLIIKVLTCISWLPRRTGG